MKYFVTILVLFGIILSAHAQLTSDDLLKISEIVKASETQMKAEIKASEKQIKEYVDIRFESIDTRFGDFNKRFDDFSVNVNQRFDSFDDSLGRQANMTYALIALIVIAIVPQYIYLFRNNKQAEQDRKLEMLISNIETLKQEVEMLKNQRIQTP